jgi:hypothetical protein
LGGVGDGISDDGPVLDGDAARNGVERLVLDHFTVS